MIPGNLTSPSTFTNISGKTKTSKVFFLSGKTKTSKVFFLIRTPGLIIVNKLNLQNDFVEKSTSL